MLDNTGFRLLLDSPHNLIYELNNIKEYYNQSTGEITKTGYYKNLFVKVNGNFILINGSLNKFKFNDNIRQLTRKGIEETIENISDSLHLNIKESYVYKVEIGDNIILKEPTENYIDCFGKKNRFRKDIVDSGKTIRYVTNDREFQMYDKINECLRKKQDVSKDLVKKNMLRLELRIKKHIASKIKYPEVIQGKHLYKEDFYINLINYFIDFYFSIQRLRKVKMNYIPNNPKEVRDLLVIELANRIGLDELNKLLDELTSNFKHRNQKQRTVKMIKDLLNKPNITDNTDLVLELDNKVRIAAANYR